MTVLAGIICPDGIVIAADSLAMETAAGSHSEIDKIAVINFRVDQALVAQSGLTSITNRIVELIQERAKGVQITSPKIVTDIVEDSIRAAKVKLDDDQKNYVRDYGGAHLMLAFYANGKPQLYTINIYGSGIVDPPEPTATLGVGSYLATYLLRELHTPHSEIILAIGTLIYTINKVKDTTRYCGGKTNIKVLTPVPVSGWHSLTVGKSTNVPPITIQLTERNLSKLDKQTSEARNKKLKRILNQVGKKVWQRHLKQVEIEEKAREKGEIIKFISTLDNPKDVG